jgi:hypothetical protein
MAIKQFLRKKLADPNQLSLLDAFFSDGSQNSANSQPPNAIAPDPAIPPNHRRLYFGTHFLDYRLLRSRRRSVGFLIDDDGRHSSSVADDDGYRSRYQRQTSMDF